MGGGGGGGGGVSPLEERGRGPSWRLLVGYTLAIAALVTLCDYAFHTRTGVLSYASPGGGASLLPGHPTGVVFAGFLAAAASWTAGGLAAFRALRPASRAVAGAWLAAFVCCYAASGALDAAAPGALSAGFLALWGALLRRTYGRSSGDDATRVVLGCVALAVRVGRAFGVCMRVPPLASTHSAHCAPSRPAAAQVLGPLAEGAYAATGFFAYARPAVYGVPAWLGPLYLVGGGAVAATTAELVRWDGERQLAAALAME